MKATVMTVTAAVLAVGCGGDGSGGGGAVLAGGPSQAEFVATTAGPVIARVVEIGGAPVTCIRVTWETPDGTVSALRLVDVTGGLASRDIAEYFDADAQVAMVQAGPGAAVLARVGAGVAMPLLFVTAGGGAINVVAPVDLGPGVSAVTTQADWLLVAYGASGWSAISMSTWSPVGSVSVAVAGAPVGHLATGEPVMALTGGVRAFDAMTGATWDVELPGTVVPAGLVARDDVLCVSDRQAPWLRVYRVEGATPAPVAQYVLSLPAAGLGRVGNHAYWSEGTAVYRVAF